MHRGLVQYALFPLWGEHLRCIINGDQTWFIEGDVVKALGLNDPSLWEHKLPNDSRYKLVMPDIKCGTTETMMLSELAVYVLISVADDHKWAQQFFTIGGFVFADSGYEIWQDPIFYKSLGRNYLNIVRQEYLRDQAKLIAIHGMDPFEDDPQFIGTATPVELMDGGLPF